MMGIFKMFSFGESVEREKSEKVFLEDTEKTDQPEKQPEDDHCPICFGDFTIPCRTNCGHWFCATCILQLWNYRSTVQRCKCPICCQLISKLVHEDSLLLQEEEDAQLLRDIQRYNHLYLGGVFLVGCQLLLTRCGFIPDRTNLVAWLFRYSVGGLSTKFAALPLLMQKVFGSLMSKLIDPDHVELNCYIMRLFALLLSWIYSSCNFEFVPTGRLGIWRVLDICAMAMVAIFYFAGLFHRWVLRRHVRFLAVRQAHLS
ncbi:putative E3 ubiquitin-protein ligase-like isoform X1 [Capsicum annuum]|nr:putative E3 ubiquitin-protein ligase-like isoform X1 [Capsicum annuum]